MKEACHEDCASCPLMELCKPSMKINYQCPFAMCPLYGQEHKPIDHPPCRIRNFTWHYDYDEVEKLINRILSLRAKEAERLRLPPLIPIAPLEEWDRYHQCLKEFEAIIVRFDELMGKGLLDHVMTKDVHDILDFDGMILLSSIMRDDMLIKDEIYRLFMDVARRGGFNAVIGWDAPVYIDIPLYNSWINMLKGLELTYKLREIGIPIIGLAKGNNANQIAFSISKLIEMGISNIALHASEYLIQARIDAQARNILYTYANELRKRNVKSLLAIGAAKPTSITLIKRIFTEIPQLSIAGLSWYLDAKKDRIYIDKREIKLIDKLVDCPCPSCREADPIDIYEDDLLKAKHNLNYIRAMLTSTPTPEPEIHDLVLKRGKAIVVSDIHAWTPESLLAECMDLLKIEKPKYIIFLGDTFDLANGNPTLRETSIFFGTLRQLKSHVYAIEGCSDSKEYLISALDKLIINYEKPLRYYVKDLGREMIMRENFTDLYKFYRFAKEKMIIKLRDDTKILLEHGHQYLKRTGIDITSILERKRREYNVDWLIVGHLHKAFIDQEKHVASPGCWQTPPQHLQGLVTRKDIGKTIIIESTGEIQLH